VWALGEERAGRRDVGLAENGFGHRGDRVGNLRHGRGGLGDAGLAALAQHAQRHPDDAERDGDQPDRAQHAEALRVGVGLRGRRDVGERARAAGQQQAGRDKSDHRRRAKNAQRGPHQGLTWVAHRSASRE
jgi:hypothetical protein